MICVKCGASVTIRIKRRNLGDYQGLSLCDNPECSNGIVIFRDTAEEALKHLEELHAGDAQNDGGHIMRGT